MFCGQCGSKLSEEAIFCPYCGKKIDIQMPSAGSDAAISFTSAHTSEESKTPSVIFRKTPQNKSTGESIIDTQANHTLSHNESLQEAYDKLKENASSCPTIKEITLENYRSNPGLHTDQKPLRLMLKGTFNEYEYKCSPEKIESENASPTQCLNWELNVLYRLLLIPLIICDGLFFDYFFDREYSPALAICALAGCILWFLLVICSDQESKKIVEYAEKALDCKLPVSGGYRVLRAIQYLFNLVEAGMCIIALMLAM